MQLITGLIIGSLGSLLAAGIYERLKSPSLHISVGERSDGDRAGRKWRFLQVFVRNKKRIFPLLPTRNTAYSCRAWIQFLDEKGTEILKLDGRWSSVKEPLVVVPISGAVGTIPDLSSIYIPPREDIPPGETVQLAVGVKFEGEEEFYGFNNISYLFDWKNPDSKVNLNLAKVVVNITSGENVWKKKFKVENPNSKRDNFILKEVV